MLALMIAFFAIAALVAFEGGWETGNHIMRAGLVLCLLALSFLIFTLHGLVG